MDVEVALFDDATGPQPGHKLVLADDFTLRLGQRTQDAKRARVHPYRFAVAPQFAPAEIDPERAETDFLDLHRVRPKTVRDP